VTKLFYRKPDICECGHFKPNHGGWGGVRDCKKCQCQHYKRDLDKRDYMKLIYVIIIIYNLVHFP